MADTGNKSSPIADWYRGRSVFVTGGTGFLGKVLVEKLLRSCPDVAAVYLLMRPKRGKDVRTRMDELLSNTIFDWLRKEQPAGLNKLVPIRGDVTSPELGISPADQKILVDSVSIVFHSAATVKFDEVLKLSVSMNILGTKRLVQLCHKMTKLEALVHVSTAYCNCNRQEVQEMVYPPPADPEKIIQCVDCMEEDLLDTITPKIISSRPNTYTFTKALAEHILVEESGNFPVAIVRPSIVTAAWQEPIPGWVDNLNGPTGITIFGGKGILRTVMCYNNLVADIVPVDNVINLLITVAWFTATARPNNTVVYNCTSGKLNPVTWKGLQGIMYENLLKNPSNNVLWYPGFSARSNRVLNNICVLAFQKIPAYILDLIARIFGKKPIMVHTQKKIQQALSCLQFFMMHEWQFTNDNVVQLLSHLNPQDRKTFNFDIKAVEWRPYFEHYVLGIRKFILKEDSSTLPAARNHLRRMYWVHRISQLLTLLLLWKLIMFWFTLFNPTQLLCLT